jgi:MYXO-CTERM domain-containing protein
VVIGGMSIVSVVLASTTASLLGFTSPGPAPWPEFEDHSTPSEANCAGQPSLEFVEPSDGAMLESPITVSYIQRQACNCDDGGCGDAPLVDAQLSANGVSYPLTGEPILVELPAGEHLLELSGDADFHSEYASITVTVLGGDDGNQGNGCSVAHPNGAGGILALGLMVLLGRRRRP